MNSVPTFGQVAPTPPFKVQGLESAGELISVIFGHDGVGSEISGHGSGTAASGSPSGSAASSKQGLVSSQTGWTPVPCFPQLPTTEVYGAFRVPLIARASVPPPPRHASSPVPEPQSALT